MIREAASYIAAHTSVTPSVAVVLGSGLGAFADVLTDAITLRYEEIPGFPQATAIGHEGKLVVGMVGGVPAAVMGGRFHLYEGYTAAQAAVGVRAMGLLGAKSLIVTNAAGGINSQLSEGCLVLINDHINLQGQNPLPGPNEDSLGPRFPDMTEAYSAEYRLAAQRVAGEFGLHLAEGVYAALPGPNYETPAEIRYLRAIGADLVGMSTVPEVIAARHMGMRVLGISCVTNLAAGLGGKILNHHEVLVAGENVRGILVDLLKAVIPELAAIPEPNGGR